jgi:hypothetical protein
MPLTDQDIPFSSNWTEADRFQRIGEGHYVLNVQELSTDFEVNRVRRDRSELRADLTVHCGLAGVTTINGRLFYAAVTLSNLRDREYLAQTLATRTRTKADEVPRWRTVVDELSIRTAHAEQAGSPAKLLSEATPQGPVSWHRVLGFSLPTQHPAMIFGDGDTLKTYTADAIAVGLAKQGIRVGLTDWEMSIDEHRERVARLDAACLDSVAYLACTRPLMYERDRVVRMIFDHQLQYVVFDSVAFGCHDKPEGAEATMVYFREVRSLGLGTLHIGHMSKADGGDQKPFGSVFWFNAVRALWFARRADAGPEADGIDVGFYPRKFNLAARPSAFAVHFTFTANQTTVRTTDVAAIETLAANLPIRERIKHALQSGARTIDELAADLDEKPDTVKRTVNRHLVGNRTAKVVWFSRTPDGRIGLADRWRDG